ncbi:unnamed protein product, partial [Aphanomyces euteiches]
LRSIHGCEEASRVGNVDQPRDGRAQPSRACAWLHVCGFLPCFARHVCVQPSPCPCDSRRAQRPQPV